MDGERMKIPLAHLVGQPLSAWAPPVALVVHSGPEDGVHLRCLPPSEWILKGWVTVVTYEPAPADWKPPEGSFTATYEVENGDGAR